VVLRRFGWVVLLLGLLSPAALAQTQASPATTPPHHIRISAKVAEKLLIHKAEIRWPPHAWASRVTGTVVVALEIDKNGDVLHPKVVSGPFLLREAVLDAVQKYKYKPYLLNGKAVDVETTVSFFFVLGK
jgi:protein TonB